MAGRGSKESRPLYLDVADRIESLIVRGEWRLGERLPPLAALAAHFGVSRAVLRESCSMLVGKGLLELRHGDGTYVKPFAEDAFLRPVHAAVLMGSSDARALLEVGMWLEKGIASAAARRRSDEHCRALSEALFTMETGVGDLSLILKGEGDFHLTLADAAGNPTAANIVRILYHPLSGVLRWLGAEEKVQREVVALHRALHDSVVQMDEDAAERHLAMYRTLLRERISERREGL